MRLARLSLLITVSAAIAIGQNESRAEPKSCYDCHTEAKKEFDRKFQHDPVSRKDCEACHMRHGFSNMLILKKTRKELCLDCHPKFDEQLEGKPHVHPAVDEQLCTTCHNPHASNRKGLMREIDDDLACFVCHDEMLDTLSGAISHQPYANRACQDCHENHASDKAFLLRANGDDVCAGCHKPAELRTQHAARGVATQGLECVACHDPHFSTRPQLIGEAVHPPVADGMCDACHEETGPDGRFAAADSSWPGCEACHDNIAAKRESEFPHYPAFEGECYDCHVAHSAKRPKLLRAGVAELCSGCHEDFSAESFRPSLSVHEPVVEGRCQDCHDPHGSAQKFLLVAPGDALCTECHTDAKFAHSEHLETAGLACLDCHQPHASRQTALLRNSRRETCSQCHDTELNPTMVAHEPVKKGDCGACHDPHAGTGSANLKVAQPGLCFGCHQGISRFTSAGVEHPPVEDCGTCHGAHEAPNDKLLLSDTKTGCGDCHEVESSAGAHSVHPPFAEGDCTGCHNPHGSRVDGLIGPKRQKLPTEAGVTIIGYPEVDSVSISLCRTCHRSDIEEWTSRARQHKPVADGNCNTCHQPHDASTEHLLSAPVSELCQTCHAPSELSRDAHFEFDLSRSNCVGCHDPHAGNLPGMLKSKSHPPFADKECDACHSGPGSLVLNDRQPELCLVCHGDMESELSLAVVHTPVADGSCTDCHSPHTSRFDHLLSVSDEELCLTCHDLESGVVKHDPYAQGDCRFCHNPHSSNNASLLNATERDLCLSCHSALSERIAKGTPHAPLDDGCQTCHEVHTSQSPSLLTMPIAELCTQCHDTETPSWTATHGTERIESCVSCHDPHVATDNVASLMKSHQHPPFAERDCDACHTSGKRTDARANAKLCGMCHDDVIEEAAAVSHSHLALTSEEECGSCHSPHVGETAALLRGSGNNVCLKCHESIKLAGMNVHSPAAANCATCHTPHGGDYEILLSDSDIMSLCSICHDDAKDTHFHPMGAGTDDPTRDGPIICTSCHSPHNSKFNALLRADPGRGLCIQCHDPSSQTMKGSGH